MKKIFESYQPLELKSQLNELHKFESIVTKLMNNVFEVVSGENKKDSLLKFCKKIGLSDQEIIDITPRQFKIIVEDFLDNFDEIVKGIEREIKAKFEDDDDDDLKENYIFEDKFDDNDIETIYKPFYASDEELNKLEPDVKRLKIKIDRHNHKIYINISGYNYDKEDIKRALKSALEDNDYSIVEDDHGQTYIQCPQGALFDFDEKEVIDQLFNKKEVVLKRIDIKEKTKIKG